MFQRLAIVAPGALAEGVAKEESADSKQGRSHTCYGHVGYAFLACAAAQRYYSASSNPSHFRVLSG
jgi:hypothetical protein